MAIDPMLYEKISGRSGDPYSRLGAALAGADAAQSKRSEAKANSSSGNWFVVRYKYQAIVGAIVGGVIGIVWIVSKVFG
jgi:hypothetical protein